MSKCESFSDFLFNKKKCCQVFHIKLISVLIAFYLTFQFWLQIMSLAPNITEIAAIQLLTYSPPPFIRHKLTDGVSDNSLFDCWYEMLCSIYAIYNGTKTSQKVQSVWDHQNELHFVFTCIFVQY